jgi:uncharacterized protein YuzB (UPF0349 family)
MTGRGCADCGETLDDVNVEAWETTGRFLCELCAEAAFAEMNGDDVSETQEWHDYDPDC